ncbi:hypothetical protein QUA83_18470 [Microcoleus sp. K1-B1]|uniref:hypothetical protein n=1 Tax=Microcoleus sp. K1-B6 TaxID=2818787 RepID=UPI002FD86D70
MERIFLIDIGTRMVYGRVRSSCRGDRKFDFTLFNYSLTVRVASAIDKLGIFNRKCTQIEAD